MANVSREKPAMSVKSTVSVSQINFPPINDVVIAGGTHGNELTGVYLLQYWQQQMALVQRASFTTRLLLANPRAAGKRVRYLDKDLNRCFIRDLWCASTKGVYEIQRAQDIIAQIGPQATQPTDFVIDLHTTTSNMGISLIIHELTPFYGALVNYLTTKIPEARIFHEDILYDQSPYLYSIGRHGGLLIEVGPTPQGLLRADTFRKTERALYAALDFLHLSQNHEDWQRWIPDSLNVFRFLKKIPLPKTDDGNLLGMVHPALQDRDYQLLKAGDPMFELFSGETIAYQGADVYPVFINEAAYYDELWGVSLLESVVVTI
jgi:aspartoacylase